MDADGRQPDDDWHRQRTPQRPPASFWVDPAEELTVLFFTHLIPSSTYPIRRLLHQLVHQALVD